MRRIGQLYHYWLHEAPLLTKAATAASLCGLGDRLAQRIEAHDGAKATTPPDEDSGRLVSASTARTLRMMVWGAVFTAPLMHTWFHVVERVIPGKDKAAVAKKVVADMLIVAPAMSLTFFTVTKTMEGHRVHDAFEVAKAKLAPTLAANFMVWPFANVVVFALVPLQYRTPFVNCVSLGWNTFLSMTNKKASVDAAAVATA